MRSWFDWFERPADAPLVTDPSLPAWQFFKVHRMSIGPLVQFSDAVGAVTGGVTGELAPQPDFDPSDPAWVAWGRTQQHEAIRTAVVLVGPLESAFTQHVGPRQPEA